MIIFDVQISSTNTSLIKYQNLHAENFTINKLKGDDIYITPFSFCRLPD